MLYNAGVDVHAEDALGKMALTDEGALLSAAERDVSRAEDHCMACTASLVVRHLEQRFVMHTIWRDPKDTNIHYKSSPY